MIVSVAPITEMDSGMTVPRSPTPSMFLIEPALGEAQLLFASIPLSLVLAKSFETALGLQVASTLLSHLFAAFSPSFAQEFERDGEVVLDGVEVVDLTRSIDAADFSGLALIHAEHFSTSTENLIKNCTCVLIPYSQQQYEQLANQYPQAVIARLTLDDAEETGEEAMLSESQAESAGCLDENYECLVSGHLRAGDDKEFLGSKDERSCRYCGRGEDEVSFSNESHAFPEQIGNKVLIDFHECDVCNAHFAKLESDFGQWSRPLRSIGRIKGKKNKVPSYCSLDKKVSIAYKDDHMTMSAQAGDERLVMDVDKKTVRLEVDQHPYTPMAVFKSFAKMAIAVMPADVGDRSAHLKRWILEEGHTIGPFSPLVLLSQFIPGPLASDVLTYILLERKEDGSSCPHLLFVLQYSNYCYQIALPYPASVDRERRNDLSLRFFPTPFDTPEHEEEYGKIERMMVDLSSPERIKGATRTISLTFDEATDITPAKDGIPVCKDAPPKAAVAGDPGPGAPRLDH